MTLSSSFLEPPWRASSVPTFKPRRCSLEARWNRPAGAQQPCDQDGYHARKEDAVEFAGAANGSDGSAQAADLPQVPEVSPEQRAQAAGDVGQWGGIPMANRKRDDSRDQGRDEDGHRNANPRDRT